MSKVVAPYLKLMRPHQSTVVAVVAVMAGLAIGYSLLSSKSSTKKPVEDLENEMAPALTEEQTVAVMAAIMSRVKCLAGTTMTNAKKIKDDIAAQGHHVDNDTLRQTYILPNFERGYLEIQTFVFNEFDVEEHEVEEAATYYRRVGNKELRKINEGIRKVYKMFGAEMDEDEVYSDDVKATNDVEGKDDDCEDVDDEEEGAQQDITEAEVLSILDILAEKMVGHTINFAEEFQRKYGSPNSSPDLMDAFMQGITTLSHEAEILVLKQSSYTMQQFQKAYHSCMAKDPTAIEKAVQKMKAANEALLRSQGIMV